MFCQTNCSGGCPLCSYAGSGFTPRDDEHSWECHGRYVRWWEACKDRTTAREKGLHIGCTCDGPPLPARPGAGFRLGDTVVAVKDGLRHRGKIQWLVKADGKYLMEIVNQRGCVVQISQDHVVPDLPYATS